MVGFAHTFDDTTILCQRVSQLAARDGQLRLENNQGSMRKQNGDINEVKYSRSGLPELDAALAPDSSETGICLLPLMPVSAVVDRWQARGVVAQERPLMIDQ